MVKYGSRVFGGETQQQGGSAVGANTLEKQPLLVKDEYGQIIGYNKDGVTFSYQGFSDGRGNTGGTGGNSGSNTGDGFKVVGGIMTYNGQPFTGNIQWNRFC
jgi:hypothetical protein